MPPMPPTLRDIAGALDPHWTLVHAAEELVRIRRAIWGWEQPWIAAATPAPPCPCITLAVYNGPTGPLSWGDDWLLRRRPAAEARRVGHQLQTWCQQLRDAIPVLRSHYLTLAPWVYAVYRRCRRTDGVVMVLAGETVDLTQSVRWLPLLDRAIVEALGRRSVEEVVADLAAVAPEAADMVRTTQYLLAKHLDSDAVADIESLYHPVLWVVRLRPGPAWEVNLAGQIIHYWPQANWPPR